MSAPKGADITDAETRSALVLLLETRLETLWRTYVCMNVLARSTTAAITH